ncbi:MAG: DUF1289 domain-containing protein [Pseudomonadota bacterium]
MPKKLPSPCVDVCKYKRQGHCIACSMTKAQKQLFKELKQNKHRTAFIEMLVTQQRHMGKYPAWFEMYAKRCAKKDVPVPKTIRAKVADGA